MALVFFVFLTLLVSIKTSYALCCNYGTSQQYPGKSCAEILMISPGCKDLSGYYWVERANGSATQVYCEMDYHALGGGWERVAYYSSVAATSCPGDMGSYYIGSHLLCTNNNGSANITSATYYPVQETYSQVRGLMTGYISDEGYAFRPSGSLNKNLNEVYMDGISLGIADSSGFIKHIHSSAASSWNLIYTKYGCYMTAQDIGFAPFALGNDRTCTTVYTHMHMPLTGVYSNDMAYFGDYWEGACGSSYYYCRLIHKHFYKILGKELTSADNPLIVRVMSRDGVVIGLRSLDIYVR